MLTHDTLYRTYLWCAELAYLAAKAVRDHGPIPQLVTDLDDAIVRADRAWDDYQRAAQTM